MSSYSLNPIDPRDARALGAATAFMWELTSDEAEEVSQLSNVLFPNTSIPTTSYMYALGYRARMSDEQPVEPEEETA